MNAIRLRLVFEKKISLDKLKTSGANYSLVKLQSAKCEDRITVIYALLLHSPCNGWAELKSLRENILFKVPDIRECTFMPRLKREAKFCKVKMIMNREDSISSALRSTLLVLSKNQYGPLQLYYNASSASGQSTGAELSTVAFPLGFADSSNYTLKIDDITAEGGSILFICLFTIYPLLLYLINELQ